MCSNTNNGSNNVYTLMLNGGPGTLTMHATITALNSAHALAQAHTHSQQMGTQYIYTLWHGQTLVSTWRVGTSIQTTAHTHATHKPLQA